MKRILFLTPVYDEKMVDGLNLRVVNIVKFLSSYFKVSLLCFSEPKFKGVVDFNEIETIHYDSSFFRKFFLLLCGKTTYNIYNQNSVVTKLKSIEHKYDMFFTFYISTTLPLLKVKTVKPIYIDLVDCLWLHMKESKGISFVRKLRYELTYRKVRKLEIDCIRQTKLSFITSEIEKSCLTRYCDVISEKILVVSNGIECNPSYTQTKFFSKKIGFLGNMGYYPNQIAAKRLIMKIMPLIRSDVRCYIIGAEPSEEIKSLESERVIVTGFVDDIKTVLNEMDMIILPMETASGVQNKLITSLSYGKVVITSKRVDTGTFAFKNLENIVFADTDKEYSESIDKLYKDLSLVQTIEENAFYLMNQKSWNKMLQPLADTLSWM